MISRLIRWLGRPVRTASGGFPDPTVDPPALDEVDRQSADRLLSGIDAIDWTSLAHAYGPATTTPAFLRALLSNDRKVRDQGVEHLWSAVTHQGTVYPATVAATPFLVRILGDDAGGGIRSTLLAVLEAIAVGTSYHGVHGQAFSAEARATPAWEERLARELADVAACRHEVAKALDPVVASLDDPADDVRLQATSTAASIAFLAEVSDEGRRRTMAALERVALGDRSEDVRGAAERALASLAAGRRGSPPEE